MHYTASMRPTLRKIVFTIATLGGLAACASDTGGDDEWPADRRKRDAGVVQTVDSGGSTNTDAGTSSGSGGGTVSCYSTGNPSNSCTLPVHCCFNNYSSAHDGFCTTETCASGSIDCDGPEDCASSQHCCSSVVRDVNGDIAGTRIACQASSCGDPPAHEELCHPDGSACANGGSCITSYGVNSDLPRTLYICR
jgi:hypothetical protein